MNRLGQRVVFFLLGLLIAVSASADTKTWTGAVSNVWSASGNWAGGTPVAGDRIVFPETASNRNTTNDLPPGTLFFDVTFFGSGYTLSGNAIGLSNGIQNGLNPNGVCCASNTINLNIALTSSQSFRGWLGILTINGDINLGSHTLTLAHDNATTIHGVISGTGSVAAEGSCCKTITLDGNNTYAGATTLRDRALQIDGSQPTSPVSVLLSSAHLGGRGVIGELTTGGEIWPGTVDEATSTGILTVARATFNSGSRLQAHLNGTTAGTQYDQLRALNGVTLNSNANLTVTTGGALSVGQTFTIVENVSPSPTIGTFAGLAHGASIDVFGTKFTISYSGGDGNDIVLTCTEVARTWVGAVAGGTWSNPANWLGGVVPVAGNSILFPATASVKTTNNDLAAGTVFKRITFLGSGYVLNGNAIGLSGGVQNGIYPTTSFLSNSINANLVLTAPQSFDGYVGTLTVGNVNIAAHTLTLDTNSSVNVVGAISGTGMVRVALTNACCYGSTFLGSNSYSGETRIENGYLTINGSQPSSNVVVPSTGTAVGGRGSVGNLTTAGDVWPGTARVSPAYGTLTAKQATFNLGSSLIIEVNGSVPGTSHDQLKVSDGISLAANVKLELHVTRSPAAGEQITIVDNQGAGAVSGTFASLPEGAAIESNGAKFTISYIGGTGNDIVLTCTESPKVWSGAVSNVWSNSGNWLGGVPVSGDTIVFPATASNRTTSNDLSTSSSFESITFLGTGYIINGNAFALTNGIQNGSRFACCLSNTINTNLSLTASQSFVGSSLNLTIAGDISLGAHTLTLNAASGITLNGVISGTGGVTVSQDGVQCCYPQTLNGNNTYSGETLIDYMGVNINGSQTNSDLNVLLFRRAGGRGKVRNLTTLGEVWPGAVSDHNQAGAFTTTGNASFGSNSRLVINLNGAVPGTGYDQLIVGGDVSLAANVTLQVTLGAGFPPARGQVFVIVSNEGSQPVNGTFLNLPQGATFNVGPYPFEISYIGKSGNDIILTSLSGDPLNAAPVANNDTYATAAGSPLTIAAPGVLSNDSDPDNDPLTVLTLNPTTIAGGTVTMTANGGFTYTPPAGFTGTDRFNYVISDGKGATDLAIVTITVGNAAPVARADSYAVNEDTLLNPSAPGVLANDTGSTLTATLLSTTAHGSLSLSANGSFSYVPAANYFGPDSFTYKANDGTTDSAAATVSINVVSVNDQPLATPQSVSTNEDTAKSITLAGTDVDGNTLTYSIATSPSHGTLGGSAPNVTYTPAANYNGSDSFTFTVNDGNGGNSTATVSITVVGGNDAPVANAQTVATNEDTATNITLTGTDGDGDTLTFSIGTAPSHGTLSGTAPNVLYTPAANYSGPDSFTFSVNDGNGGNASATVSINVVAVNDAPVANAQSLTTNEDTAASITLTGTDGDGDTLTFSIGTAPSHGTLSGAAPNVLYTPAANYSGPDSFTFSVNDGNGGSSSATVSITVLAVNNAPVANAQSVSTNEDAAVAITLSGSDADGDTLTFTHGAPPHGVLSGVAPNLTYTPNANYNGSDSFSFTVTDGSGASSTAQVSISIAAVNDAPVLNAVGNRSTNEGSLLAFVISGSDVDGDALIFSATNLPTGATFDGETRQFSWTPSEVQGPGSFNVTFSLSDGTVVDDETISIAVAEANEAPVLVAIGNKSGDEGSLISFTATATDADLPANTLTFSLIGAPAGASMTSSGAFNWTPSEAQGPGTYSITVRVTDNATPALFDEEVIEISVSEVNEAPVLAPIASVTTGWNELVEFTAVAADVDVPANTLTFSLESAPSGASINAATGAFSWTPSSSQIGTHTFTVKVTDNGTPSLSDSVSVTITVTKRRTTLTYNGALSGQYSDDAGLKAKLTDLNSGAPLANREIHFAVGTQNADAFTDAAGIAAPVVLLTQAPASVSLSAIFDGDDLYEANSDYETYMIKQEDARGTYTGPLFTSTLCPGCSNAVVTLSATVRDITATLEAAGDVNAGDIRNATLTFVNRDAGGAVLCTAPLGLVNASDLTTATGTCTWNVNLGNADSTQVTVGIVIGGYYIRNAADENSVVTVSKPLHDSITGGGYLILETPAGSYAGTIGSKLNFGFNVKFNKSGKNLQGNMNIINRRGGRVYQIKATAMTSLAIQPGTTKAMFVGKANIQDITDPLHPISMGGNATLQVNLTDAGEPGSSDTIGITVWDKDNALWFSSRWNGTRTTEQTLNGGNLVIH